MVGTYMSGLVNENDLVYLGDHPAEGLNEIYGIRREEIDGLHDHQSNELQMLANPDERYTLRELCEIVHLNGAEVEAVYVHDFYAGKPVLTRHEYGAGRAFYLAAKPSVDFLRTLYRRLTDELGIGQTVFPELPSGVFVSTRSAVTEEGQEKVYYFLQNFSAEEQTIKATQELRDLESDAHGDKWTLDAYGVCVLV